MSEYRLIASAKLAFVVIVLIVLTLVRLVALDMDPPFTKRVGDISDEGYWAHNARMRVLTGEFKHDPFNQALITAPLYTGINYLIFTTFGTSLGTARLASALSGVLVLLIGAAVVFSMTGDRAWAATYLILLALNDLFFAYNRIGFVESTLNAFIFLSFMVLHVALERRSVLSWFAVSGGLFGLAALTKFTAVYVLLPIALVFAVERVVKRNLRASAVLVWTVGVLVPLLTVAAIMWVHSREEILKFIGIYSPFLVGHEGLYYKVVAVVFNPLRVFTNEFIDTLSVTLLLLLLIWRVFSPRLPVNALERLCAYWLVGTLATCAVAPLQADRRYWGILIPLAIMTSRLVAWAITTPANSLAPEENGRRSNLPGSLLRLGIWYILTYSTASLLVVLIRLFLDARTIPYRLGVVQAFALVTAAVCIVVFTRRRGVEDGLTYFLVCPLLAYAIEWNLTLLWPTHFVRHSVALVVLVPLGFLLAHFLGSGFYRHPRMMVRAVAGIYVAWSVAVMSSAFVRAEHSVKETALSVDRSIKQADPATGRYYFFGKFAHQLALEGDGIPLFFFPSNEFQGLNREFLAFKPHPLYYLHSLPPQLTHKLSDAPPLPRGLEGRILGTYCLYRFGDYCNRPFLLVRLDRFDAAALSRYVEEGALPETGR